jgi:MYXO-CTERM domain-containing protein
MRRLALVLLGCAIALTPSTAWAKEIAGVSVCAADGCQEVTDEQAWQPLVDGGPGTNAPARPLEHFTVRIRVLAEPGETVEWSYIAVPSRGLMQAEDGSWMTMTPVARKTLLGLTQGRVPLEPGEMPQGKDLPAPRVDEVFSPAERVASATGGDASPWPWVVGAALVASVLLLLRHRRRDDGAAPAPIPQ